MPWTKPTHFTSWSFSRLQAWRQCPLKAKLSLIDKIKEPPKPDDHPMVRGDRIHKLAEAYLKGAAPRAKVPEELVKFSAELLRVRRMRKADPETVPVEETWAFRKDWTITTYDDWDACWLRVKLDFAVVEDVVVMPRDIKTGKFSLQYNVDEYMEQLDLYATAGLIMYSDVGPDLKVSPRLMYTDLGLTWPPEKEERVYTPDMLPALKKKWEKAVKPMLADRTFAPKPNRFCSTCWFRKGNAERTDGGQVCKFN